ncbi:MAG: AMP-binding protein [Deltaproteobacteria bacterium]|nr:AMP-binding protein [Deltaproteobacteria bacterium]
MNIRELIESRAAATPEKIYLYFEDQKITYENFNRQINRAANAFTKLGIGKADHFAVMLPNSPEFLYSWFGLNKIGAVQVPLNTNLSSPELQYILEHSEAKGIVIHKSYLPVLTGIHPVPPHLKSVIVVGDEDHSASKTLHYHDIIANASDELPPVSIAEDDPAVIIYTSGTTGNPKGVQLSHRCWMLTGESWTYMIDARAEDRIMTSNPLFHANAEAYSTIGSLVAGASLILLPKFSRSQILEQAREYHSTILVSVMAAMPMIWSRPNQPNDAENPIRLIMAGGVPSEYYGEFQKRFGGEVVTIYSLTEAMFAIMAPREGARTRKPTPGVGVAMEHPDPSIVNEVKIVDESGKEAPRGDHGQIIIKNPAVMIGYFKDPEKTAETKREGWIYTGDIGYQDEEGYFYFVGRSKELLRRRGELISPAQIESVLLSHPKVLDGTVIGVPTNLGTGEEEVKAYVIPRPGEKLNPEELVSWCEKHLADFKVPRYIEFRTDFPRTPKGSVQKNVLKSEKKDLTVDCYDRLKQ